MNRGNMPYFSIEKTGCSEWMGICNVRFDCFLEPGDYKYEESLIDVTRFDDNLYPGEVDENGNPTDSDEYYAWIITLPEDTISSTFCVHFCQFEYNVTMAEILYVGELALDMSYRNWLSDDVTKNYNLPIETSEDPNIIALCQSKIEEIIAFDFSSHPDIESVPYRYKQFDHTKYVLNPS